MGRSISGSGSDYKRHYEYLKEENKRNRDLIKKLEAEIKELKQVKNLTMLDVSNNEVAVCRYCKKPVSVNGKCTNIACSNWLNKG